MGCEGTESPPPSSTSPFKGGRRKILREFGSQTGRFSPHRTGNNSVGLVNEMRLVFAKIWLVL